MNSFTKCHQILIQMLLIPDWCNGVRDVHFLNKPGQLQTSHKSPTQLYFLCQRNSKQQYRCNSWYFHHVHVCSHIHTFPNDNPSRNMICWDILKLTGIPVWAKQLVDNHLIVFPSINTKYCLVLSLKQGEDFLLFSVYFIVN